MVRLQKEHWRKLKVEATTIQKYIHITPRKLRLVADMVRKMSPKRSIDVLGLTDKYAAKDLLKSINTALANAKTLGLDLEKAIFKKLEINEASKMKRFRAGTRGRARPYAKKMAHIKIVISDQVVKEEK